MLDGDLISPALSAADRRSVRRDLERAGVALCGVDTSFGIADPEADLEEAEAFVDLAADLGGPMIRLFGSAPESEPAETVGRRAAERLRTLADRGGRVGVTIAVETHDSFARGEALAAALHDAPGEVGVIWDTLNSIVAGERPERTFAAVAERLVHVHVKDGGSPPDPERNVLFGRGSVPFDSILAMLRTHGYDGWLSVEWEKHWQPTIADADVALPSYAEGLRALLADPKRGRGVSGSSPLPPGG